MKIQLSLRKSHGRHTFIEFTAEATDLEFYFEVSPRKISVAIPNEMLEGTNLKADVEHADIKPTGFKEKERFNRIIGGDSLLTKSVKETDNETSRTKSRDNPDER